MRVTLILIAMLACLTSCSTALTPFSSTDQLDPQENMGVIVFGLESNTNIISIQMSGSGSYEFSGELVNDDRIIVSSIPAGTYDIFKVKIINKYHYIDLDDSEEQNWKMNIQPNKINYVGHFSLVKKGTGYRVQMRNDSTSALIFMEKHFGELLNKYPLVYSKDGAKDEYFPFLNNMEAE